MKSILLGVLIVSSLAPVSAQTEPLILMRARFDGQLEPRLEAVAMIDQGEFRPPGGVQNKDAAAFIRNYLTKDSKFFVVFGGGAAGTINLTEAWRGCNNQVSASGPFNPGSLAIARIRGSAHGLAINTDRLARGEIWRRAPSTKERAAAVAMAKTIFGRNGVARAQVAKMQIANLAAIDVDRDNRAELVGTFRIHSPDPERPPRYVFLIAEREGQNYKTAFSRYIAFPDSNIFNIGDESMVDYLDLDRDGVGEIVTSYSSDRAHGYHIYRRVNGEWKLIYDYATEFCRN